MSVLIKGMKMPKSCGECKYNTGLDFFGCRCSITYRFVDGGDGFPSSCPLVEIPEHGRLIDADKMCEDLRTVNPVYKKMIDWAINVTNAQSTVLTADDRVKK